MFLLWAAVALSFTFWLLVMWLGFHEPLPGAEGKYKPYFGHANWWPYPIFFLTLAPVLWLSWEPLLNAWGRLAETGVLRHPDGRPDANTLIRVRNMVRRQRGFAVVGALVIALAVNGIDRWPLYQIYSGKEGFFDQKKIGLLDQQIYACDDPGPFVKWILAAYPGPGFLCDVLPEYKTDGNPAPIKSEIAPPTSQVLFFAITTAQQFLIVFFPALAVLQILLHTVLFGMFGRFEVARKCGLCLMLNCRSPVNEFGLEHWNQALNNFYWAACPAMLAVFLSRASTPPEDYLPGQVMLGVAVPACLLAPMVATIIVRQARLPKVWTTLNPDEPIAIEDYRRQQLWPLERNWSSKLGIVLAFALAALSLGFEFTKLIAL